MAIPDIKKLSFEELLALRQSVNKKLSIQREELEKQIARLGPNSNNGSRVDGRAARRGTKVPAKFRSRKNPSMTWSGRGAIPRWMREEMKGTKLKKEAFLIK
jgi:DNA-binding protein H-NS